MVISLVKIWSLHGALNMHTLTGHQKGVRALAINDRYLATAGFDQTVLVWNWSSGRKVASFRAHNEVVRISPHDDSLSFIAVVMFIMKYIYIAIDPRCALGQEHSLHRVHRRNPSGV